MYKKGILLHIYNTLYQTFFVSNFCFNGYWFFVGYFPWEFHRYCFLLRSNAISLSLSVSIHQGICSFIILKMISYLVLILFSEILLISMNCFLKRNILIICLYEISNFYFWLWYVCYILYVCICLSTDIGLSPDSIKCS